MYNFYLRRKALDEQHVRRQNPTTYTEPLQGSPITEKFISEFANKIRLKEEMDFYSKEKAKYPDLKLHFEKLVPLEVSYEEFWRRYEYRTDLNRLMEKMKSDRMSQSSTAAAKREIHSLRRRIFKSLRHMSDDAENPITSDSSEPPDEAPHEDALQSDEGGVLQEIESTTDSDYSDFDGTDIHIYPDQLEDEDVVEELDLDLSATEFDAAAIDELEMGPQVHIYPDSPLEANEGVGAALKMEDRILDDEYGSLEFNSELGSLAPIADLDTADEDSDEDLKMLGKIYNEDDLIEDGAYQDDDAEDKADNCECACVIS